MVCSLASICARTYATSVSSEPVPAMLYRDTGDPERDSSPRPGKQVLVLAAHAGQVAKRRLAEDDRQAHDEVAASIRSSAASSSSRLIPSRPAALSARCRQHRAILRVCKIIDIDECGDGLAVLTDDRAMVVPHLGDEQQPLAGAAFVLLALLMSSPGLHACPGNGPPASGACLN
jgi:hypothetical protein